jgi:hypothetical protein
MGNSNGSHSRNASRAGQRPGSRPRSRRTSVHDVENQGEGVDLGVEGRDMGHTWVEGREIVVEAADGASFTVKSRDER